jgi:hypothetical protein
MIDGFVGLSYPLVSHRHLASPSAADSQSGRTRSGKDRCVHSLRSLTIQDLELNLWPQQHSQRRALRLSLGQFQLEGQARQPLEVTCPSHVLPGALTKR